MKYFIIIFFVLFSFASKAQVKLLALNELEERIAKGGDTTFVINFWATWCGPCVKELPNFEKLQVVNAKKPLKVILISLDFKSKLNTAVIPFVKKHKLISEVYLMNAPNQQVFIDKVDKNWSGAIPATLIINTNQGIRAFYEKEFSYLELDKTLTALK
jgi:thiol-disulfide isomerase/thioredoxin